MLRDPASFKSYLHDIASTCAGDRRETMPGFVERGKLVYKFTVLLETRRDSPEPTGVASRP